MESEKMQCSFCQNEVMQDDNFCFTCGSLFIDINCEKHSFTPAIGVCVICGLPFCDDCCALINKHHLCNEHKNHEIFDHFAKV